MLFPKLCVSLVKYVLNKMNRGSAYVPNPVEIPSKMNLVWCAGFVK